ncbi:hypothetical protein WMZ97_18395 [Lentibacillus sp. N15]|uniref:hypothetical protein n=1 Tax=Lentibacillus songyuanensis TaxID=3136161 RepID=UPI0031B9F494
MARVFKPKKAIFVPASGGHPKNAEYRIAWGTEQWNKQVNVSKVQMVYNGTVAGMLSPSFPDETLDEQAVIFALHLLKDNKYGTNSNTIKDVLILKHIESKDNINSVIDKVEDDINDMTIDIFGSKRNPIPVIVHTELRKQFKCEDSTYAFLFRVEVTPTR